jgi:hypothetical protein
MRLLMFVAWLKRGLDGAAFVLYMFYLVPGRENARGARPQRPGLRKTRGRKSRINQKAFFQ